MRVCFQDVGKSFGRYQQDASHLCWGKRLLMLYFFLEDLLKNLDLEASCFLCLLILKRLLIGYQDKLLVFALKRKGGPECLVNDMSSPLN